MAMPDKNTSPPPAKVTQPAALPRVDSTQLLRGQHALEIEHAGQRYLLRVTRENKLILTK